MDKELHIKTGTIPAEHSEKLHELRKEIAKESIEYRINEDVHDFVTDRILHHFLIARKYDVMKACTMLKTALEWRAKREPHNLFKVDMDRHEAIKMSHEAETGKIRLAGRDRYDREVVIFDNSVQNTQDSDGQLTFLAWNLEMAIHTLPPHVDKYVVFMHLENFSVLNCPPYQTTRETILMLTTCYPERLGHCICYKGPSYFYYVFNLMKSLGLIDPRTLQKITFIQGDVSDGSPNDALMTGILGRNWKELTAAEGDILEEGCSPGFRHAEYWPWVLQRWDQIISILSNSHNGGGNASPTDSRGDAMKRLSMKIPAHYDMGSVSSGSESYSGGEEDEQSRNKRGQAESPTNVSLPRSTLPNLSFRQFIRDPLTQVVLLLRPLVALLKALFHILGMVFEWADNIKDMPVYGTVTVQICIGTFIWIDCLYFLSLFAAVFIPLDYLTALPPSRFGVNLTPISLHSILPSFLRYIDHLWRCLLYYSSILYHHLQDNYGRVVPYLAHRAVVWMCIRSNGWMSTTFPLSQSHPCRMDVM